MTISYNWLSEYISGIPNPPELSKILTSIGLEVESMEPYESIRGGLQGLVVGEVKACTQHPQAYKLKLTQVDVGDAELLQIVCGAPNVAVGQKVIVAKPGVIIYPVKGEPLTLKTAKIRGVESFGMICAQDEVGLGEDHAGIVVLPETLAPGSPVADHFEVYRDWIYAIGLTPNRMDAMSHAGVARDVAAYLHHHEGRNALIKKNNDHIIDAQPKQPATFGVSIENTKACRRYCGALISNITVAESPLWLKQQLQAIGQRPINNIVDITNYLLHDSGQPLHAFDAGHVAGKKIRVMNLPEGSLFRTLDDKERKLSREDLMICDGEGQGLALAGVFGGADSGVSANTKDIFLESAWFDPVDIRKTSFRHGLRTDAAMRFEKTVDISNTFDVLRRAARMIAGIAGGEWNGSAIDVYPEPQQKATVLLSFAYLRKLSGKQYAPETVRAILEWLGFEVINFSDTAITLSVPFSKPDVRLPADVVEEVMRIDGYDNIEIPKSIMITPAHGATNPAHARKEKTAGWLTGAGFSEIFTSSITNAAYFEGAANQGVRLLNNLSAVHNIMRPSMLETGLEAVAYNINRKNSDLQFFEFGKTYHSSGPGRYEEHEHLCLYATGDRAAASWKSKALAADLYYLKGLAEAILAQTGISAYTWNSVKDQRFGDCLQLVVGGQEAGTLGHVSRAELGRFGIKQGVQFLDLRWEALQREAAKTNIRYKALPNQLPVYRDLAMIVDRALPYQAVEAAIGKSKPERLRSVQLFDVFESDKLGAGKKSLAISLTFQDDEKTMTDKEIDGMMNRIMRTLEQDLGAEIRKATQNTTT